MGACENKTLMPSSVSHGSCFAIWPTVLACHSVVLIPTDSTWQDETTGLQVKHGTVHSNLTHLVDCLKAAYMCGLPTLHEMTNISSIYTCNVAEGSRKATAVPVQTTSTTWTEVQMYVMSLSCILIQPSYNKPYGGYPPHSNVPWCPSHVTLISVWKKGQDMCTIGDICQTNDIPPKTIFPGFKSTYMVLNCCI